MTIFSLGRATTLIVCGALVAVLTSGCGTRRDMAEIKAAAQPVVSVDGQQGLPGAGAPAEGGGIPVASDSAAPGGLTPAGSPAGQAATGGPSGGATAGASGKAAQTPAAATGSTRPGTPGPSGAAGGAAAVAAAVGDRSPIRLGSVSTLSGPIGAALGGGPRGVQAWAAAVNAKGGIAGHPVELTVVDDGNDPARHRSLTQQLAEERKVIAFVQESAPLSGQGSVPYNNEHKIPVVGSSGGSPWFAQNPTYFPQMSSDPLLARLNAQGLAQGLAGTSKKKVALIYCAEINGCKRASDRKAFTDAGLTVVYDAEVSIAAPDYTAQCLGARNAGAEVVYFALDTPSIARVASNCKSVGFQPVYSFTSQLASDSQLSKPELEGAIAPSPTVPWFFDTLPAVAEFRAAMKKYAPGVAIDGSAVQGWTSGKLFERAVQNLTGPPTSAAVLSGLNSLAGDDLGGLTYPLKFKAGDPNNGVNMPTCFWVVKIASQKWSSPDNGTRHCK